MTTSQNKIPLAWIHSPLVDLMYFDFAWVWPCLMYFWLGHYVDRLTCDYVNISQCSAWTRELTVSMLLLLSIHRNYTFVFVYCDRSEFARNRPLYTWAPVVFFALLFPFAFYEKIPAPYGEYSRIALLAITMPNGLWNVFHVFLQKYGFLRAYGVRLCYGSARLEKTLILSWLVCGFLMLVSKYDDSVFYMRMASRNAFYLARYMPLIHALRSLFYPALVWVVTVTACWIVQEYRNFSRASVPKLIYAAATALVCACFAYSIILGFIALAASHAFEYIAFVNIYGRRKPGVPAWIRNPLILNPVVIGAVLCIYLVLKPLIGIRGVFMAYVNCESYLHFLFDGKLWRLRDDAVKETVMKMGTV
ncbi:MAG: hypothetical protein HY074_12970 [Deltaproteobacteria bacterium]|nr:hypothetical protein [Deltaproteobacteria bacterium]